MKPTKNRLLVRVEKEEVKEGETPKGNAVLTAEVLKVGPDALSEFLGKRVVFSPFGFDEVEVDGETLVIISDDMILAVYEK